MSDQVPVVEGKGLVELLSKAVIDPSFREKLFADRKHYAKQYQLSTNDTLALEKIEESRFIDASKGDGQNVAMFWEIGIGITIHLP